MNEIRNDYDSFFQLELGQFFRTMRIEKNYSIEYVSKYLEILPSRYARYENGSRSMPLSIMKKLTIFYSLDYYEIFKIIDQKASRILQDNYIILKEISIKEIQNNKDNELTKRIEKLERDMRDIKNNK